MLLRLGVPVLVEPKKGIGGGEDTPDQRVYIHRPFLRAYLHDLKTGRHRLNCDGLHPLCPIELNKTNLAHCEKICHHGSRSSGCELHRHRPGNCRPAQDCRGSEDVLKGREGASGTYKRGNVLPAMMRRLYRRLTSY